MSDRRQDDLLLRLMRGGSGAAPDPAGADAARLADLCTRHGLSGLVGAALTRDGGNWPDEVRARVKEQARKTLLDNIVLLKALQDVGEILGEAGIEFIVLKGASLLGFLYDRPELRPMTDLDLLIHKKDWPAASRALSGRGYGMPTVEQERYYSQHWYHQLVHTPLLPSCAVELHWNIESQERTRIDPADLWSASVPCVIEGRPYRRLGNEHLLVHLAVHLAHHHDRPSLHWVEDLHRLAGVDGMDWSRVATVAKGWRVENCLAYSLAWVEHLFPGALPPQARNFRLSAARRALLRRLDGGSPLMMHRELAGDPRRHVVSMLLLDRWRDAARYIIVHATLRLGRKLRLVPDSGIHG